MNVEDLKAYLNGDRVPDSFVDALLARTGKNATTVFRTIRLDRRAKVGSSSSLKSPHRICSASMNPVASLYAALSMAHDNEFEPKYVAVVRIDNADVCLTHAEILRALLSDRKVSKNAVQRAKSEKEVIIRTASARGTVIASYRYEANYSFYGLLNVKKLPASLEQELE